jgi:methyl-accepting chemotaxis protein
MGDQYSALQGELENRTQAARQSIAHHFAEARRMQHLFLKIVVGVLIACTVILFVMSRVVAMSVSKPLFDVIQAVERAQGGDLTAQPLTTNEAGIAGDEIVGLQRGFDSMISNLRAMVANTGESALGLAETAQQLRQSGSKLHDDNATQERALVRTVEFIATGALEAVEMGLDAASHAAALAQKISTQMRESARDGLERVDETDTSMQKIEQHFQQLGDVVAGLSTHSISIGEITEVIDKVADDTSLLALNASVIAAQSGEHGRSFSVIANEMRTRAPNRAVDRRDPLGRRRSPARDCGGG